MFEKVNAGHPDKMADRLAGAGSCFYHYKIHKRISDRETCIIGTFPLDFRFGNMRPQYFVGMSVPPVMTAQIGYQIYKQWLSKL